MDSNNGSNTKPRIELKNGQWADLKDEPLNGGDLRAQRMAAHVRGFPDEALDGFVLILRKVVAWSFGPVDDATLDTIPLDAVTSILEVMNADEQPPLESSSAGTETEQENNLGSGGSGE